MSDSDTRLTPPWLLDEIRRMGPIALDPCTTPENPTGSTGAWFFLPEIDGLDLYWRGCIGDGLVYVNPPYSRGQVIQWAQKAAEEALEGCEILFLSQADVSTQWFRFLRTHADAVCFLEKRVGFLRPDGSTMPGAKFGSALWYWGRRRALFRSLYDEDQGGTLGWVVDLPGAITEVARAAE